MLSVIDRVIEPDKGGRRGWGCTRLTRVTSRELVVGYFRKFRFDFYRTYARYGWFFVSMGETFGQNSAINKFLDLFEEAEGRINVSRERKNCWENFSEARGLGKGLKEH